MHELSIVKNILDVSSKKAEEAGAKTVEQIDLEIGELAGVEYDAFVFAWDIAVRDTILAQSRRNIHRPEGKARCEDCQHEFKAEALYDPCPNCGSFFSEIIQGRELKIKSLIVS